MKGSKKELMLLSKNYDKYSEEGLNTIVLFKTKGFSKNYNIKSGFRILSIRERELFLI